jgi:hypothetical protein
MSWYYKYLAFLALGIGGLPFAAIAVSSRDMTSHVSTIQNLKSKIQNSTSWRSRPDFGKYFQQAGVKGTFLLSGVTQLKPRTMIPARRMCPTVR